MPTRWCLLTGTVGLLVAACGGAVLPPDAAAPPGSRAHVATAPTSCDRAASSSGPRALGPPRTSSTVALATHGARTLAYVADDGGRAVQTIDVDTRIQLASTPLEGTPSQLIMTADGRVVVALKDKARLAVLE